MKKLFTVLCMLTIFATATRSQSKVIKEVSEGISSQMFPIVQDASLVGYLSFTQLERASEDSFNYKISIMDENLNDIGTIKFRDQKLLLQAVSFESDVICCAYFKSNLIGVEFKNQREYKRAKDGAKNYIMTQFLGLDGKIIGRSSMKAEVKPSDMMTYVGAKGYGDGKLKHAVQLKNIPGKGFVCFFGDDNKKNLITYNTGAHYTWLKQINEDAESYHMMTSGTDVYLLMKKKDRAAEGGYELLGFNTADSSALPKYVLKDKKGNSLRAISFENDPVTGKPYISGEIINPSHEKMGPVTGHRAVKTPYLGAFTISFNGHKKNDIKEVFSYWQESSNNQISEHGRYEMNKSYCRFEETWRDYQGNTYFAGSALRSKANIGGIVLCVATSFTIIYPAMILAAGNTIKIRLRDAMIVRQDPKGMLTVENSIPLNRSKPLAGGFALGLIDSRSFHQVDNSESKTNYMIVDDTKNIVIYNVTQKKVARTIPRKDGNVLTSIFPAKEGHVMVSEYNKKDHETRFSIEAL